MKEFFKKLISNSNDVSSKRVSALFTLLNVIVLTYIATFKSVDMITPQFMFESLCWIVAGGLGLTAVEKIFSKNKTSESVKAADVVNTSDTESNTETNS